MNGLFGRCVVKSVSGLISLGLLAGNCYAATIVVQPNTVISQPTRFSGDTLDMSRGSFIIKNGATLTIDGCTINGTLSPRNPVLFNVDTGNLVFTNNIGNIKAVNLQPHPMTQSLQYVIQVALGSVDLEKNRFSIDQGFEAGFLMTTSSIATTGFKITENRFENFHGVLYLINSNNAFISKNMLFKNSYGNIVIVGNNGQVVNNTVEFSGNNHLGNSMDIMNSSKVTITGNQLLSPTCHGIYVMNSRNLLIDDNRISSGITYAMNVLTYPEATATDDYLKAYRTVNMSNSQLSNNIIITNNYMAQNRYGITASDLSGLTVKNNYFIQRFTTDAARKFWTDNSVLLKNITQLTWQNNWYKEAFTQENGGDNTRSKVFVPFPETGGIVL